MVRYEIQKELVNGEINVSDLPDVWNSKMEEYLGVTPLLILKVYFRTFTGPWVQLDTSRLIH